MHAPVLSQRIENWNHSLACDRCGGLVLVRLDDGAFKVHHSHATFGLPLFGEEADPAKETPVASCRDGAELLSDQRFHGRFRLVWVEQRINQTCILG
jgi:hypothetical protein